MNLSGIDLSKIRLINGECIIELHSLTEDEIDFNGGKLKIVNKVKTYVSEVDHNYMFDLVDGIKKSRYKDKKLIAEYNRIHAESQQEADPDKENIQDKQAVRRGKIIKIAEIDPGQQGWDYECYNGWYKGLPSREVELIP